MVIRCWLIICSLSLFVCISFMRSCFIISTIVSSFFPCIEWSRKRNNTFIPYFIYACTNFTKHIEVFTTSFFECRNKSSIKCITANMFYSINTESINTHFNIFCISINQIFLNFWAFCIQVNTVIMNCTCLTSFIFPVFKPTSVIILRIKQCQCRPLEHIIIVFTIPYTPVTNWFISCWPAYRRRIFLPQVTIIIRASAIWFKI